MFGTIGWTNGGAYKCAREGTKPTDGAPYTTPGGAPFTAPGCAPCTVLSGVTYAAPGGVATCAVAGAPYAALPDGGELLSIEAHDGGAARGPQPPEPEPLLGCSGAFHEDSP